VTLACDAPGIVSVSEFVDHLVAPPLDVTGDVLQDDLMLRVFMEREDHQLQNDAIMDIGDGCSAYPCRYDDADDLPAVLPIITAGTEVTSHLIHFDPYNGGVQDGIIAFGEDVLGISVRGTTLSAGDNSVSGELGAVGTTYPSGTARAWDLGDGGYVELLGPRTIAVHTEVTAYFDQMRVVTAPCDSQPTDIPEDFFIPGDGYVDIRVPAGATHLFFSPDDEFFGDNVDLDGDYEVQIQRLTPGDLDGDTDIDLDDFVAWVACIAGPDVPFALGCERSDLDNDGDADLADFALFQASFTGP
jgi:hypothetical protein